MACFFYMRILPNKPDDITLASYVRKTLTKHLLDEFRQECVRDSVDK